MQGKVIFCNCDDPFESNFFKYFALNFNALKLKKLIATSYVPSSIAGRQLPLFDIEGLKPKGRQPFKIEINEVGDYKKDGAVNLLDVEWLLKNDKNAATPLMGDNQYAAGDFRSRECVDLLKRSDIVVTNPPFSLFREYVAQLVEKNKKFLIIGNKNAITYKETFRLIKDNKLWAGFRSFSGGMWFVSDYDGKYEKTTDGIKLINVPAVWFTNMDNAKRHEEIPLYKKYSPAEYPKYDNYDAIEVSKTADIPLDYRGVMGVPITFLDKYNPNQFEIVGITKTWFGSANKTYPNQIQVSKNGKKSNVSKLNDGATLKLEKPPVDQTYYIVDGKYYIQLYARVLIRSKSK